jgi:hypothetical protein
MPDALAPPRTSDGETGQVTLIRDRVSAATVTAGREGKPHTDHLAASVGHQDDHIWVSCPFTQLLRMPNEWRVGVGAAPDIQTNAISSGSARRIDTTAQSYQPRGARTRR